MIELPGLWSLTPLGFALGVVATMYLLIVTGRLVPRKTHDLIVAGERKRGDEWKETALAERSAKNTALAQNSELLESGRVVRAVVRSSAPGLDESTHPGGA